MTKPRTRSPSGCTPNECRGDRGTNRVGDRGMTWPKVYRNRRARRPVEAATWIEAPYYHGCMPKVLVVLGVIVIGAGVTWFVAGGAAGPSIEIVRPQKFVGIDTPVQVAMTVPGGRLATVTIAFEQKGAATTLLSDHAGVSPGGTPGLIVDAQGKATIEAKVGRANVPTLATGPGRLVVTASRPVLWGLRTVSAQATRDVEVRLERPRVTVLSTHHYINLGGSEMMVYRAEPPDVVSGVRVGDLEYPGYPAAGIEAEGVSISDPTVRVAFFALLHDQKLDTPMRVFARDEAGNTVDVPFESRVFPKPAKQSRIELTDAFIDRVVPAILAGTKDMAPTGTTLEKFLVINRELRQKNNATIAAQAARTERTILWRGVVFHPFTNTAVESAFADRRTYLYQGKEVDQQTHLGFDLASYAGTPIVAANRGRVLFAGELGIYGNTVILDHGMGVQSLYGHLSSIGVAADAMVEKGQELGRSGMTGMAGGDHLHFTMLVAGRMVNPIEWWDSHWIEDRILRKLRDVR
jgi:murein DD-endopeptidase MepM/ murein hydrolase activator NlpD